MLKPHATYSPSGAVGWMNCPGWAPSEGTSSAAAEGTLVHDLAASALLDKGFDLVAQLGQVRDVDGYWVTVSEEMVESAVSYVTYVSGLPGAHYVETELALDSITGEPGAVGTADFVAHGFDELHVADLKFGFHKVEVRQNPQLMLYALAACYAFDRSGADIEKVTLHVFQPRIGNVASWTVSRLELEQFGDRVSEAVQAHGRPGAQLNPGEAQCKWCRHAGTCEAQAQFAMTAMTEDFVDLTQEVETKLKAAVELVQNVDIPTLARMAKAAPFIEQWTEAVQARLRHVMERGELVPGFKLVAGRQGNRKWVDEQAFVAAVQAMGVDPVSVHQTTVLTPAAAQKKLPKEIWLEVEQYVTRAEGQPIVVPEGDKRPAISTSVSF